MTTTTALQKLMDEYFGTHQYNDTEDWRKEPLTYLDPVDRPEDEEKVTGKKSGVVRLYKASPVTIKGVPTRSKP